MTSKRQLLLDNERLRSEVGYLRGRIEELESQPAQVAGHMGSIVRDFFDSFRPPEVQPLLGPPVAPPGDWTDQIAPRTARQLDDAEYELNDRLEIVDELERDP